jgi:imidazolonepropionase-like amidohydrolase
MKKIISSLLFFFFVGNSIAQQTPAAKQTTAFSIEGATAHIGNGEVIENSLLMFRDGKITFIGSATVKTARLGTVINATGKQLYPGFIAANTTLGLVEIDAVSASDDQDEIGAMNPHIRSLIAYNAESKVIESMRPNGVLMAQVTPRGGTVSGTSSVVQLDAWNWEDAAIKTDDGIHLNWPTGFTSGKWWLGEDPALKPDPKYIENIDKIKDYFTNATNYLASNKIKTHLPYQATAGLFDGSKRFFIHVSGQKEITDAITISKELGIEKLTIVNGEQADKVADLLVKHNVSVILERPHRNPNNEDDSYDATYTIANTLIDKGILVSIGMEGQMERMNARNLPFYAGTFAAFGLDKEVALQLITLNAAKILGIDSFAGSLEVGKDATLFLSEGDALEMRGNILTNAFIQGRAISLETHQTELWKRYAEKYK